MRIGVDTVVWDGSMYQVLFVGGDWICGVELLILQDLLAGHGNGLARMDGLAAHSWVEIGFSERD